MKRFAESAIARILARIGGVILIGMGVLQFISMTFFTDSPRSLTANIFTPGFLARQVGYLYFAAFMLGGVWLYSFGKNKEQ